MRFLGLSLLLLSASGDTFTEGERAYAQGEFPAALEAFRAAETAAGEEAPAPYAFNRALAALRSGALVEAEVAAEVAAARGGADYEALRDFLFGNVAFARCDQAERLTRRPEAGLIAYDRALTHARDARDAWQAAVWRRSDWPEARRNVERAVLRIARLEQEREEAKRKAQKRKKKPDPPKDDPDENRRKERRRIPKGGPQLMELTPAQVRRLFEKLSQKEREKVRLRLREQQARRVDVEQDW